jgi:hypothetical protein
MPSLTLDLFAEPEPAPVVTAHIPGFQTMKPETQEALCTMVRVAYDAASRGELLPRVKDDAIYSTELSRGADSFALARLEDLNHHAYAFVAQARHAGSTDSSLIPVQVSAAGRREFDMDELARFANEVLRGVRSIKPTMTPERWAQATQKVREMGGKS